MKLLKIFLYLSIYALTHLSLYADSQITINSSDTEIDISELIEIRIDVNTDLENTGSELQIPGLENFHVVGSSRSESIQSSHKSSTHNIILALTLKGKVAGEYTIGPIMFDSSKSNDINIIVTGAEVFLGGQIDTTQIQSRLNDTLNSKPIESSLGKIEPLPQESRKFADIMKNTSLFPIDIQNTFLYFLLCILLFLVFYVYKKIRNILREKTKNLLVVEEKIPTNYFELLEVLQKKHIEADKDAFYGKVGDIMRQYLDEKIELGLSTKTFKEVGKKLNSYPSLRKTYESIYYPEYNKQKDNKQDRIQLIDSLQNELI